MFNLFNAHSILEQCFSHIVNCCKNEGDGAPTYYLILSSFFIHFLFFPSSFPFLFPFHRPLSPSTFRLRFPSPLVPLFCCVSFLPLFFSPLFSLLLSNHISLLSFPLLFSRPRILSLLPSPLLLIPLQQFPLLCSPSIPLL